MRRSLATLVASLICLSPAAMAVASPAHVPTAATATVKRYKNCTALNKVYKHGAGRAGARDKTSGKRVTTFRVNTRVYNANKHLDRDKDGIACEKR